jgi:tetratricopeptide (TPR) repeat protein
MFKKMFYKVILITAFCVMLVLQTEAATVYTATGKVYKGRIIKDGKNIIIETANGNVTLKAKTVIHIDKTETIDKTDPKKPTEPTVPATQPGATTQPPPSDNLILPSMVLKSGAMVLGNATRPEPIVYMNMRALAIAKIGAESARLRRQLDLWRAHTHDRLRKTGQHWITPKDFVRHRKSFVQLLSEADRLNALAGKSKKHSSSKPPPPLTAKQKRYKYQATDLMFKAARSWADPPMQNFLLGVAQMHARNFKRAETSFKLGIKQAPLLAGLHQGLGLASAKQYRYLGALEAFLEVLRLKPDSKEAVYLVRETMKQVAGSSIKSTLYRRAVEALIPYTSPQRAKSSSSKARYVEWLMPANSKSKSWRVTENTMPTPPFDRLEYRQAVGVPLSKHTLLVDARVVTGAVEVFVRIDGAFIPARLGRVSRSSSRTGRPPVATIYLPDYELTPLKVPTDKQPPKGGPCTTYALGIFGQMKQAIRPISGTFKPGEGGSVSSKLLPGEATSPVLSNDGKLLGFLAGKTAAAVDGAGVDKFISLKEISSITKRAISSRRSSSRANYSTTKRVFTPIPIGDRTFVIYAILGEVFKSGV